MDDLNSLINELDVKSNSSSPTKSEGKKSIEREQSTKTTAGNDLPQRSPSAASNKGSNGPKKIIVAVAANRTSKAFPPSSNSESNADQVMPLVHDNSAARATLSSTNKDALPEENQITPTNSAQATAPANIESDLNELDNILNLLNSVEPGKLLVAAAVGEPSQESARLSFFPNASLPPRLKSGAVSEMKAPNQGATTISPPFANAPVLPPPFANSPALPASNMSTSAAAPPPFANAPKLGATPPPFSNALSIPSNPPKSAVLEGMKNTSTMTSPVQTQNLIAKCEKCRGPVNITGTCIAVNKKYWHADHFCCSVCSSPLKQDAYHEKDDNVYCEKDYQALIIPKCEFCNKPIEETLQKCINALGKMWHVEVNSIEFLFCSQCGKTFDNKVFMEHNGKAYCEEDYNSLFASKCFRCELNILGDVVTALGKDWHADCFSCETCKKPFEKGSYFTFEGMPYCELHYHEKNGSLCANCLKPVIGRCLTALGKKFHPEHFVCSHCMKQLGGQPFKEDRKKPYCNSCHTKLFG